MCGSPKRWVLYHPDAFQSSDVAVIEQWSVPELLTHLPQKPVLEVLQREGEMLIVPPRWWHAVINTGTNVAVAENYVMEFRPASESRDGGSVEDLLQAYAAHIC